MKRQEVPLVQSTTQRQKFSILMTPLCAVVLGGTLLLSGCGGGGGGNSTGTGPGTGGPGAGGTPPTLAPAIAGLNAIVRGTQAVTVTSITTTAGQFDQARQADPTNKDAQLGFAVSEAVLASVQVAGLGGGTIIPAARSANSALLSPTARTAQLSQALVLWRLPQFLSNGGAAAWPRAAEFLPTSALTAQMSPRSSSVTPVQVQTALTALDANLVQVEAALKVVESDPNYTYTLADPSKTGDATATVKIGGAEIQLLSAVVSTVRSVANAGLAYNADPGAFSFKAQVPTGILSGALVSPAQYLPAGPFLTLASDGAARMGNVHSELNSTALSGIAAIDSVRTRSNAGFLLNPGTLVSSDQLSQLQAQIAVYQTYLTGSQTVPLTLNGTTINTRVNLSAFLDHPPADLRVLLPTLPTSTDSSGLTSLTMNGFPDKTFGGIFPDGLPMKPISFHLPVSLNGASNGVTYSDVIGFALTLHT